MQWNNGNRQAELAYDRGEPIEITVTNVIDYLSQPVEEFLCAQRRADDDTGSRMATRLKALGLVTIGQLIQLTDKEIAFLYMRTCDQVLVSDTWWKGGLRVWLYDNGRLLRPIILPEDLREQYPIPYAIQRLREERATPMTQAQTETEQFVLTHLDALRGRVDGLELWICTANCLQNAGIEYIWQVCLYNEAELIKIRNLGRRSLLEIKEFLADMDLRLGMTFSQESLALLRDRS